MFAYALASNTCSEVTNGRYWLLMFLTVAVEVKSEFMLEGLVDSPEDYDFTRKYSKSIIVY